MSNNEDEISRVQIRSKLGKSPKYITKKSEKMKMKINISPSQSSPTHDLMDEEDCYNFQSLFDNNGLIYWKRRMKFFLKK